jgi:sporulation protein YlmC with PRC-barrel domain
VKKTCMALFLATLTLPLAYDASAQQPAPSERRDAQHQAWQKPHDAMESSRLIGAKVKGTDGKDVGEIDGLIVSKDGKVSHVLVGKGGVAGIGETKVVVPWSDVKMSMERDNLVITMDSAALDRAPRYEHRASRDGDRTPAASPSTAPKSGEKAR